MAGIDSTGSLHGRQSVKKQTNTCRESPVSRFIKLIYSQGNKFHE